MPGDSHPLTPKEGPGSLAPSSLSSSIYPALTRCSALPWPTSPPPSPGHHTRLRTAPPTRAQVHGAGTRLLPLPLNPPAWGSEEHVMMSSCP